MTLQKGSLPWRTLRHVNDHPEGLVLKDFYDLFTDAPKPSIRRSLSILLRDDRISASSGSTPNARGHPRGLTYYPKTKTVEVTTSLAKN